MYGVHGAPYFLSFPHVQASFTCISLEFFSPDYSPTVINIKKTQKFSSQCNKSEFSRLSSASCICEGDLQFHSLIPH